MVGGQVQFCPYNKKKGGGGGEGSCHAEGGRGEKQFWGSFNMGA